VDELSRAVSVSRAVLAKRFVEVVGESPMHNLAGWRIHLAKRMLRDGGLGVGEISGRVGYESEAAFNRAFRRLTGLPPAAWREAESRKSS
jgi:AraC-like DNA-binding protein